MRIRFGVNIPVLGDHRYFSCFTKPGSLKAKLFISSELNGIKSFPHSRNSNLFNLHQLLSFFPPSTDNLAFKEPGS